MSLTQKIDNDFIESYKAKDAVKSGVLRMLKSSLKNSAIEKKSDLSDDEAIKILQKEIKQRREAIEQYKAGGRDDLAAKEESEIAIIEPYLPAQLSEEDLITIVKEVIAETGASGKADFGKVMGLTMARVAGKADGNAVSKVVASLL